MSAGGGLMHRFSRLGFTGAVSFGAAVPGASLRGLGDLPGGSFDSRAFGISSDGRVVVGHSDAGGLQAFRWTAETGMTPLGAPGTPASPYIANATNADG